MRTKESSDADDDADMETGDADTDDNADESHFYKMRFVTVAHLRNMQANHFMTPLAPSKVHAKRLTETYHSYRLSYAHEVGSSFDPDLEDVGTTSDVPAKPLPL